MTGRVEQIVARLAAGATRAEVAKEFQVTHQAVSRSAVRYGIPKTQRGIIHKMRAIDHASMTRRELAVAVGAPLGTVTAVVKQHGLAVMDSPLGSTNIRHAGSMWERLARKMSYRPSGCWIWIGSKSASGYGVLRRPGASYLAHRIAYEELVGPIPPGLVIDHLCREALCVNPWHLDPVENAENVRRGVHARKPGARKTVRKEPPPFFRCGHPRVDGRRACLPCERVRDRRRKGLKRAGSA